LNILLLRSSRRTSKLQKKPQALQNKKFIFFYIGAPFLLFWIWIIGMDPDPNTASRYNIQR
jgi:hypothetical protein